MAAGITHWQSETGRIDFPTPVSSKRIRPLWSHYTWASTIIAKRFRESSVVVISLWAEEGRRVGYKAGVGSVWQFEMKFQTQAEALLLALGIPFEQEDEEVILEFADDDSAYAAFRALESRNIKSRFCNSRFTTGSGTLWSYLYKFEIKNSNPLEFNNKIVLIRELERIWQKNHFQTTRNL